MTRPNLMIIEDGYATIIVATDADYIFGDEDIPQITTTRLHEDRYVRIDDGRQYPQLCAGASRYGNTLIYHDDEQLARDCNARLFKTRTGFDAAIAKLTA